MEYPGYVVSVCITFCHGYLRNVRKIFSFPQYISRMIVNPKSLNSRIKDMSSEERPREKMRQKGLASMTDHELLALLLSTGSREHSALELARMLLKESAGLIHLASSSPEELMKIKGIGEAKAVTIAAAFELGRRRQQQQNRPVKIINSASAGNYLIPRLQDFKHEVLFVIFLDKANQIKSEKIVSAGGVAGTVVDVKIIFKEAINQLASSIIVAHNHPSGTLRPSEADKLITEKIRKCGEIMDIKLVDHIIIAGEGYYSFADEDML